ncbi:MAG: hypothetical protein IPN12_00225 [Rhodocyclaceae bacterium]|jgi:hypothetical protein|nr:hypothetical protein [Rhodocyclaceae bacterium]MDQ5877802.1 hypothetical protein [Pseudomonadota bacterium]MBK9309172.1 hypothetical protein [Rhodocyclaceae bacterium]MDQ5903346.1 hypothetical protein [Pseudomonadota bacterium]MDQ5906011.1 hypothetical protein [Pseudomonadota bacterium]
MPWNHHTHIPAAPTVAAIAIQCPDDGTFFLADQLYQWDSINRCWLGELSGTLLKVELYWWRGEAELLEGLPA